MLYELGKKFFLGLKNTLNFVRVALVFLSFAVIIFWIFELGMPDSVGFFSPFFDGIRNATHLFYNRIVTIDGISLDFTFLLDAILFLLIVWFLKFAIEHLNYMESQFEVFNAKFKKQEEAIFNATLEQEFIHSELKNDKIIFALKIRARNLAKDKSFDHNIEEGQEEKESEIRQIITEKLKITLGTVEIKQHKGIIFLFCNRFERINGYLKTITNILQEIERQFIEEKWHIYFKMAVDAYGNSSEVLERINNISTLLGLNIENKILCLSSFMHRYKLNKIQEYAFLTEGSFKISDRIEDVYDIFELKGKS